MWRSSDLPNSTHISLAKAVLNEFKQCIPTLLTLALSFFITVCGKKSFMSIENMNVDLPNSTHISLAKAVLNEFKQCIPTLLTLALSFFIMEPFNNNKRLLN